jgi:hypothetical protein
MKTYLVEMHGESREVYYVQAETEEDARENWMEGDLMVQESSSMEIYSVREDPDS